MTGWKRAKCSGKKDARVWRALSLSQEAANFALASKAPAWYAVKRNSLAGMGHVDKVPDCILEQRGRNAPRERQRGDSASERNWPAGRNPRLSSRTRLGRGEKSALARTKELHRPLDKVVHTPAGLPDLDDPPLLLGLERRLDHLVHLPHALHSNHDRAHDLVSR